MYEDLFIINESLIDEGIKIHLKYFILENFDNTFKEYDYSDSVITPETEKIKKKYTIENIKEDSIIASFRQFYWRYLKIDPTKIRPSGEALIRRLLQGKKLPKINYFVDGYNWASAVSRIPIGAYNFDSFEGAIELRHAKPGESFLAIGGKERKLKGNELITISRDGTILSQFPYRDADKTKVTENTKKIIITCLGIDGIEESALDEAIQTTIDFLRKCKLPKESQFTATQPFYVSNF